MQEIATTIAQLNASIEQLMKAHGEAIEAENKRKTENKQLLTKIEEQKKQLSVLTEKNKIIKLAKSLSASDEHSTDTKLKINELVREVDRCIALLNR